MKLIHTVCPNCGAPIKIDETTQKTVCDICGITFFYDREKNKLTEEKPDYTDLSFEKNPSREQAKKADSEKKTKHSEKDEQYDFLEDAPIGTEDRNDPNRKGEPLNPIRKPVRKLQRDAEKRNESLSGGGIWRAMDFLLYFLMVVLIMFSVRAVLLDPVRVEGTSMVDTLLDKEVMLVNRTAYAFSTPKRGDIVICYYPEEYYTQTNQKYATRVKRVIAVAGDRIEIKDGGVYINGVFLNEPYLNGKRTPDNALLDLLENGSLLEGNIVPEGTVFVMGDNRPSSRDSRLVGPIPLERVVGKAFTVIFPFERFRLI